MSFLRTLVCVLLLHGLATGVWAESKVWVAGETADLNTAVNWDPPGVPGTGDTAVFSGSSDQNDPTFAATLGGGDGFGGIHVTDGQTSPLTISNAGGGGLVGLRFVGDAGLQIDDGAGAVTIGGGNSFYFNLGSGTSNFVNSSDNPATIGSNVTLNATGGHNPNVTFSGTGDWLLAGNTSGTVVNLTQAGPGTLTLSGTYNHPGSTTLSNGTLVLANQNSLQNRTLTLDGGSLVFDSGVAANAFTLGGLQGSLGVVLQNNSLAPIALTVGGNNANTTYGGSLTGPGSLIKSGSGVLTLSGTNTHAGGTSVNAGVLAIPATGALPGWNEAGRYAVGPGAGLAVGNNLTAGNIATMLGTGNFASGASIGFDTSLGDRTYSDAIANVGGNVLGLVKVGANTLTLTAANTHTGDTAVRDGTLRLAHSHALQNSTLTTGGIEFDQSVAGNAFTMGGLSGSGNVALRNNAATPAAVALTVGGNNANTTYSGVLSGSGGLAKVGSGTLVLTGNNVQTGTTTINEGMLQVGAGGTSGTLGMGDVGNHATLVFNRSDALNVHNRISGSGDLVKRGAGTLTLLDANTYAGSTTIEAGTLRLGVATSVGNPVGYWEMSEGAGTTLFNSVTGAPNGTLLSAPAWVDGPAGAGGDAVYFDGTNQYANIAPDAALNAVGEGAFSVSAWVKTTNTGTWYNSIASKFGDSGINNFWGLGWMQSNQLGFVIRDSGGTRADVRAPSGWGLNDEWHHIVGVRDGQGQVHLYLDGVLRASATDNVGSAANTRPFQLARHSSTYVQESIAGVGIWNYALDGGDVAQLYARRLAPWGGSLPHTTALRVAAGATFDLNGMNQAVGSLSDHNGASGTVLLGGGTLTTGGDNSSTTFSGTIAGDGGLVKTGTGTLRLLGRNTYAGSTGIEAGTLQLGQAGIGNPVGFWEMSEGAGATITNTVAGSPDGTLYNSPVWVEGPGGAGTYGVSFNGTNQYAQINPNSALNAIGSGEFTVSAWIKSDTTGGWYRSIVSNFGLDGSQTPFWGLGWMAANQLGFSVRNASNQRGEVRAPTDWGLGDGEWHHLVGVRDDSGVLYLYLDGVLFGTSSQAGSAVSNKPILLARHGGTYVNESIAGVGIWDYALGAGDVAQLHLRGLAPWGGSLPEDTALQIAAGGTFDLNDINQTIGSLADHNGGGGTVLLGGATLTTGGDNLPTTFSGGIAGAGGLVKTGSGTFTLAGLNTYTGPTAVEVGTLLVNGTHTGAGQYTVHDGATVGGTGTIGGNVSLRDGGILSPGTSPGQLDVLGDLAFNEGAFFDIDIAGTDSADLLMMHGGWLTPGNATIRVHLGFSPDPGDSWIILDGAGGIDEELLFKPEVAALSGGELLGGWKWFEVGYGETDGRHWVVLSAVPEPGGWLMLLLALACGLLVRRR